MKMLAATILALATTTAHAELRNWHATGHFENTSGPSSDGQGFPGLFPIPLAAGQAYQLDIVYETSVAPRSVVAGCAEYAAIKSVKLTRGARSVKIVGPGVIFVCNDQADGNDTMTLVTGSAAFSVELKLAGPTTALGGTKLPASPPTGLSTRFAVLTTVARSNAAIFDGDSVEMQVDDAIASTKVRAP